MTAKRFVLILLMLVALPATSGRTAGAQQPPKEYIIKAALLKHLGNPRYVKWPADAIEGGVFHIGVLGRDPFGRDLRRRLEREVIELGNGNRRAIRVHLFSDPETPIPPDQELHLLFIPREPRGTLERRLEQAGRLQQARRLERPILIVGDERGQAEEGPAMISLYADLQASRVRLEVNPRLAAEGRLTITPALIELAAIRYPESSQQANRAGSGSR